MLNFRGVDHIPKNGYSLKIAFHPVWDGVFFAWQWDSTWRIGPQDLYMVNNYGPMVSKSPK